MVEVLVALSLFVLAFGTVLSPLQLSRRSAVECSQRLQALALANDLLEQQRTLPFEKIVNTAGTRDIYSYTLTVQKQPNLKVLQLQLRWGQQKVLDYGTMISGDSP
jgi:Tfp pilus assembly protein PilV